MQTCDFRLYFFIVLAPPGRGCPPSVGDADGGGRGQQQDSGKAFFVLLSSSFVQNKVFSYCISLISTVHIYRFSPLLATLCAPSTATGRSPRSPPKCQRLVKANFASTRPIPKNIFKIRHPFVFPRLPAADVLLPLPLLRLRGGGLQQHRGHATVKKRGKYLISSTHSGFGYFSRWKMICSEKKFC